MSSHTIESLNQEPSRNLVTHGGMWLAGMVLTKSSHWHRRGSLTQSKIQPTKWCVYKTSGYFGSPRGAVESLKKLITTGLSRQRSVPRLRLTVGLSKSGLSRRRLEDVGVNPSVETVWYWHTRRSMVFPSQIFCSPSG